MVIFTKEYIPMCFLFSASNSPIMIDSAQIAQLLKSINYGLPCPFSRVRFEESACASYLPALRQGFPVQIITLMCKFSRFVLLPV
jgi:hypothetical protein